MGTKRFWFICFFFPCPPAPSFPSLSSFVCQVHVCIYTYMCVVFVFGGFSHSCFLYGRIFFSTLNLILFHYHCGIRSTALQVHFLLFALLYSFSCFDTCLFSALKMHSSSIHYRYTPSPHIYALQIYSLSLLSSLCCLSSFFLPFHTADLGFLPFLST
jgi:hypothetical protein